MPPFTVQLLYTRVRKHSICTQPLLIHANKELGGVKVEETLSPPTGLSGNTGTDSTAGPTLAL